MNAIAQCADTHNPQRSERRRNDACCNHYDALLRRLLATHNGTPSPRVIGITSCSHGAGVSTIALNLAVRAADRATGSVLLIDANRRHPSLHKMIRCKPGPGLSEAVSGAAPAMEYVVPSPVEGLCLLRAGDVASSTTVAESATVSECFDGLRRHFPLIFVDLPPVDDLSTSWDLIGHLDGVLLVVEAENTRRTSAQRVIQQLRDSHAKLLGVVFNKRRTYIPDWLYRLF